jgi:hypothetical protein
VRDISLNAIISLPSFSFAGSASWMKGAFILEESLAAAMASRVIFIAAATATRILGV